MAPRTGHERHVERFLAFLLIAPTTSQRDRFFAVLVVTPLAAWLVGRAWGGAPAGAGAAALGFGVGATLLRARIARNRVLFEQIRERVYAP